MGEPAYIKNLFSAWFNELNEARDSPVILNKKKKATIPIIANNTVLQNVFHLNLYLLPRK